ncbi:MAG: transketolase C-terminal domain-containing protein, partial [Bacilli bacterium]
EVFGRTILDLAKKNTKIIGITPAMPSGCSLNIMMKALPERCFDVGIAEQHAVTFAAGLAAKGFIPFCNIYSTFAQRSYDQIIHDVALQKLNVVLCFDRGGLVGSDGSTHQGSFDLAFLRPIPNMTISAPMNESELRNMLYTAQSSPKGPFSIRYPRGTGVLGKNWETEYKELEIGKGRCIKEGNDIAIISIGTVGNLAINAINKCDTTSVALYDMRFLKPIDINLLHLIFKKFKKIITIEDGVTIGGLGSAVCEFMEDNNYLDHKITRLGIPDKFIPHGTQEELYKMCGFDCDSILKQIKEFSP